jgi:flavin reductase (DIM6/NTAB) family NADH-FMN oxidoreductase RutF
MVEIGHNPAEEEATALEWKDPDMFEPAAHGNKPFAVRIPSLVVSRGAGDQINFLTAMWFSPMGAEPSRMVVAILKRTLTYKLILERGEFVMSAPTDKMMDVVVFAGYVSGREVDKWQAAGLTPVKPSKVTVPLIGEAIGNVEYRLVQVIPFGDEMDLFVGEVLATHMRKGSMEGELFREGSDPLLYMGTKYNPEGKALGKFFTHMGKVERANYESPLLKQYLSRPKVKKKE